MTTRLVVSDTSPIRVFQHLSQLHLLSEFFDEVLVPPADVRELSVTAGDVAAIQVAAIPGCRVAVPKDAAAIKELEAELQSGEAEALVLARERGAEVLIDERAGRLVAQRWGLGYTGVLGLLVRAKQKGLIPVVVPLVFRARDEMKFFVSDAVIEQIRILAGE